MAYKTWFVYDKETGYILSGFDSLNDDCSDGYNIYTRPYKYKSKFDAKDENCVLDFIYNDSRRTGLHNLKKENLVITTTDKTPCAATFVENPEYKCLWIREACRGWWKLNCFNKE